MSDDDIEIYEGDEYSNGEDDNDGEKFPPPEQEVPNVISNDKPQVPTETPNKP